MEREKNDRIAILMTVHNRKETTLSCLRHIADMDYDRGRTAIDIFMTDDGCTDGTANAVREEFPLVMIIRGDGSLFWNRGMHAAWKEAAQSDYDYYWWVNDDTMVFPDAISRMLNCAHLHDDKSIAVGCTCSSDAPNELTYGGWKDGKIITDASTSHRCDTMHGNLVLIPRHVFKRIGMNDPFYRHSLGDTDYGLRATENGLEIWTVAGFCGVCDLHGTQRTWMNPDKSLGERWQNFISPLGNNPFEFFRYRRRHFGLAAATTTLISNFAHFLFPKFWVKQSETQFR